MKKISSLLLVLMLMGCTKTIVEYVEVEVPIVEYKTITEYIEVEVPFQDVIYPIPEGTLFSVTDKYIDNYPVHGKTFGYCELVHEIIFYSTKTHYWVQKYGGCDSDGEPGDYYYLYINRSYIPIAIAIDAGYITHEQFEDANLGTKVEW